MDKMHGSDRVRASAVVTGRTEPDQLIAHGWVRVECVRDGEVIWVDEGPNLIVTTGRNKLLDETLAGSSYTAAWYMGLTDGTPTVAAGDTMASHAGWAEVTAYDEATREALTFAAASSGSKATSADASFTISANSTTVGGVFITSVSTKGGSTGVLFAAKAFTLGDRTLNDGDVLNVGYTALLTAS